MCVLVSICFSVNGPVETETYKDIIYLRPADSVKNSGELWKVRTLKTTLLDEIDESKIKGNVNNITT